MKTNLSYHCEFTIIRKGVDYKLKLNDFSRQLHLFLPETEISLLTIGGGEEDYIQVHGLNKQHLAILLVNGKVILRASSAIELMLPNGKRILDGQERLECSVSQSQQGFGVIFPNETLVEVCIYPEKILLSNQARTFLEQKYGVVHKIQEEPQALLFASENRILKILNPQTLQPALDSQAFIKVLQQQAKLPETPEMIKIYEVKSFPEYSLYLAEMELYTGETLENYMARKGIVELAQAKPIIEAIANNLAFLQQQEHCYDSLTPKNILLFENQSYLIKITSMLFHPKSQPKVTPGFQMVPEFSAPEQLENPQANSIAANIFSLGALFYSLVVGEAPFQALNTREYIYRLSVSSSLKAEEIHNTAYYLPFKICKLISTMLSFQPEQRPTPQQIIEELSKSTQGSKRPKTIITSTLFTPEMMDLLDQAGEGNDFTLPSSEEASASSSTPQASSSPPKNSLFVFLQLLLMVVFMVVLMGGLLLWLLQDYL